MKPKGKLKRFMLTAEPTFYGVSDETPMWQIAWEIRTEDEPKIYSEIEKFYQDDFVSIADYITKKSYRKLSQFIGTTP